MSAHSAGGGRAGLSGGASVATWIVYELRSGEILHVHQHFAVAGATQPANRELEAQALSLALQSSGRTAEQLGVLTVRSEQLTRGMQYKVDVRRRELVAQKVKGPRTAKKPRAKRSSAS